MLKIHQFTIEELITNLELISDKNMQIEFEIGYVPCGFGSWRGIYLDLCIYFKSKESPIKKPAMTLLNFWEEEIGDTQLSDSPTVKEFLTMLHFIENNYFRGYKGGLFRMHKYVPIWVASSISDCNGFLTDLNGNYQAVNGIEISTKNIVIIKSNLLSI